MLTFICLGTNYYDFQCPSIVTTWDRSLMCPVILYSAACSLASTTLTGLGLLVYSE